MPNGCSAWILSEWLNSLGDGAGKICCDLHDVAYSSGVVRWVADWALYNCFAGAGFPVVAGFVGLAVASFGWLFYKKVSEGKKNDEDE